jgi:small subunit ribosomal protein S18
MFNKTTTGRGPSKFGRSSSKSKFGARPNLKRDSVNGPFRKRVCRFCKEKINFVDYKDLKTIERFVTDRGKIVSKRASGLCAKHQRMVSEAVKKARFLAIVGYTKR